MSSEGKTWFGIEERAKPLVQAGFVLGLGLGGFFDGIVFHQILQTHHMLSAHPDPTVAGDLRLNVLVDGLFHLVTYLLTIAGIVLVWRAWRRSTVPPSGRTLLGSALIGWGGFNLVEGTINHHVLQIHHVWPDGPGGVVVWNVAFLLWGALMLGVGIALVRTDPAVTAGSEATDDRAE